MTNLVKLSKTMTSREIAELTGKRHDHVLRDIDNLLKTLSPELGNGFSTSTYVSGDPPREYREFTLDRDSTYCLVAGYDANSRMRIIKRWQELESAQAHPAIEQPKTRQSPMLTAKLQLARAAKSMLRMSATSTSRMLSAIAESEGISPKFLPAYVDEPLTRALTALLKDHGSPLASKVGSTVNPALLELGILEHLERTGSKGDIKKFWSLTTAGLAYGRNETSPQNPRETQPLYFVDRFPELLNRIEAHLSRHIGAVLGDGGQS